MATYVFEFNRRHITEALEGHEGDSYYYIDHLMYLFGEYLYYLIPLGILLSFNNKSINAKLNWGIIGALNFVFIFFSFIAQTKVSTYLFFIIPLALVYISIVLDFAIQLISKMTKSELITVCTTLLVSILVALSAFNPIWVKDYLSPTNLERNDHIYNARIYRNLNSTVPDSIRVVMNMNSFDDINVMFYNKGITAYHWTLTEAEFKTFEQKKLPIAVYESHGKYQLPKYVQDYPYLFLIKQRIID